MLIRIPRCDALGQNPRVLRIAQVASIAVSFGCPAVSIIEIGWLFQLLSFGPGDAWHRPFLPARIRRYGRSTLGVEPTLNGCCYRHGCPVGCRCSFHRLRKHGCFGVVACSPRGGDQPFAIDFMVGRKQAALDVDRSTLCNNLLQSSLVSVIA